MTLDLPTVLALIGASTASAVSLVRWRSGDRQNVLSQATAEIASAAGQTVTNLMEDNQRLRKENADLLSKLAGFETRVERLTAEISALRSELAATREQHTHPNPGGES